MVNALFGVKNFGRIVGITNSFTGLVGLLVLPLSDVAIGAMRSKFWKLNLAQACVLCHEQQADQVELALLRHAPSCETCAIRAVASAIWYPTRLTRGRLYLAQRFGGCMWHGAEITITWPQALALLPLYGFCYAFWRWSRQDLVDLRFTGQEKDVTGEGSTVLPVSGPVAREDEAHDSMS